MIPLHPELRDALRFVLRQTQYANGGCGICRVGGTDFLHALGCQYAILQAAFFRGEDPNVKCTVDCDRPRGHEGDHAFFPTLEAGLRQRGVPLRDHGDGQRAIDRETGRPLAWDLDE